MTAGLALAGCGATLPAAVQRQASLSGIDGLVLDEAVTADQLKVTRPAFSCLAQDSAGRFQLCLPKNSDSQASAVLLLDGHVGGFIRTFDQGLAETAEQWSLSLMGSPTNRKVTDGRTDLTWDDNQKPFARLLNGLEDFDAKSAFLVMTRRLARYLEEHPALLETTSDAQGRPEGMTPGKCLAMPFLCPAT